MSDKQGKKPSGLGAKRKAEEENTAFVLPEEQAEDELEELRLMLDTLEVTLAEENEITEEHVKLMRALVHEADRLLKSEKEGSDEIEAIMALGLYYLGVYEDKDVKERIEMLRSAEERFVDLGIDDDRLKRVRLMLAILGEKEVSHGFTESELERELVALPSSTNLIDFITENCQTIGLIILAAGMLQDGDEACRRLYERICDMLDDESLNEVQMCQLLILKGGLQELLEEDPAETYSMAENLGRKLEDPPQIVQDFLSNVEHSD